MLKKFNDLYSSLIFESQLTETSKDWHRIVLTDDEFLKKYLIPLKCNADGSIKEKFFCVDFVIARENTFRAIGDYEGIIEFLNVFNVDDEFLPNGVKFEVFSPTISIVNNAHINNCGEGYTYGSVADDSLYAHQSLYGGSNDSRWYDFFETIKSKETDTESVYKVRVKRIEPKKLKTMVKEFVDEKVKFHGLDKRFMAIQLEFKVNCNGLSNNLYDEMTYFKPDFKEIKK